MTRMKMKIGMPLCKLSMLKTRYVSDLFIHGCWTACGVVNFLFVSLRLFPVRHGKHVGGLKYLCV